LNMCPLGQKSEGGKGHHQRPLDIPRDEFERRWDLAFGHKSTTNNDSSNEENNSSNDSPKQGTGKQACSN